MKIFCDWVVKNEEERIEASLRSLLPYIDAALVIDTGSTDNTINIVNALKEEYPNIMEIKSVDIGPHFDISIARNTGLRSIPTEFWSKEPTWYAPIAGDEVYDYTAQNLRPTLENLSEDFIWVYTWGRNWAINEETGERYINNPKFGRPTFYRHIHGMEWQGVWNRERIIYPGIGSYFPYENRNERTTKLYWDADLWYDHYGWADSKRHYRTQIYNELNMLERQGIIKHPRA